VGGRARSARSDVPDGRRWSSVGELLQLADAQRRLLATADAVLVPAALSDFTVRSVAGKIPSGRPPKLRLVRAPKVLPELRRRAPRPALLVGFKLAVDRSGPELLAQAEALRRASDADWVAANDRASLGAASTQLLLVGPRDRHHWVSGPKTEVAGRLLDDLGQALPFPPRGPDAQPAARRGRPPRGRRGRAPRSA
jgi:phosphopantothenoylcysteine synthetase/decarboxylase